MEAPWNFRGSFVELSNVVFTLYCIVCQRVLIVPWKVEAKTRFSSPQIKIRTWQPNELAMEKLYNAGDFYNE